MIHEVGGNAVPSIKGNVGRNLDENFSRLVAFPPDRRASSNIVIPTWIY